MTFPTPDQVRAQLEDSLQPIAEVLREEVRKVFASPANYEGNYWFEPIGPLATRFRPMPSFTVISAAFDIVKAELAEAGWKAEFRTHRSEASVKIEPIK